VPRLNQRERPQQHVFTLSLLAAERRSGNAWMRYSVVRGVSTVHDAVLTFEATLLRNNVTLLQSGKHGLILAGARWRDAPVTQGQLRKVKAMRAAILKKGLLIAEMFEVSDESMTKGAASDLIARYTLELRLLQVSQNPAEADRWLRGYEAGHAIPRADPF